SRVRDPRRTRPRRPRPRGARGGPRPRARRERCAPGAHAGVRAPAQLGGEVPVRVRAARPMNLYLDGSWLAEGIRLTGPRRFSAELNAAVLGRLAGAGASVTGHVFSIGQRVESHFRRPDARYVVVPTGYRFLLYANALFGLPDLRRVLDPPPDAIHLHDPIRFAGSGNGPPRTPV